MKAALIALMAAALPLLAPPAQAQPGWSGFYTGPARPAEPDNAARSVCISEILRAQIRHRIPGNILLGIGLQEAGMRRDGKLTVWPYAVNAAGEGRSFDSRSAAMAWVRERQRAGVDSIDVGCMQVNLRWHPDAFTSLEEGFDPAANVEYAARFLKRLYARTGDWVIAAGSYHSFSPDKREIYLASLGRNTEVANARIEDFRALAAERASAPAAGEGRGRATRRDPGDRAIWSADLARDTPRRSIYSGAPMEPILPVFLAAPGNEANR